MKDALHSICTLSRHLEEAGVPYTWLEEAAMIVQGINTPYEALEVSVQWDLFAACEKQFAQAMNSATQKTPSKASFGIRWEEQDIIISCRFNTTVRTDPYRIEMEIGGQNVYCRSLYAYLYGSDFLGHKQFIQEQLQEKQRTFTQVNEEAWNQNNYQALLARYGEPAELAGKIKANPEWRLFPFYPYMKDLKGKKVLHLLGSNGVKATAMALLGADVTVVDFSKENAAFAEELAKNANVSVRYITSDVFSLDEDMLAERFDYILMELGVLHYFITLEPLMERIKALLAEEGSYILHEFHPISTKLITSTGKKHKVTGNYFDANLTYQHVAFSKHMPDGVQEELKETVHRKWTLGEIITSVGSSGMRITILEEEPNHKIHDIGLPKTYTLVAKKS
ncbi:class I SAM-dependent methyltransferase [Bacillus testis]|uniref:class I SAM-dependent methyltransferase n=1 Tax=Bacillus testis TaxID=1622072 RepID=UPI000AF1BBE5|nr:class I SAM-dependent methyltransferase [Bacillus testis]